MEQEEIYLTPEGLTKLQVELEHLETVRRREVADELKRAAEIGGTVDNAEYEEAKRNQDAVERRIGTLEKLLHTAKLIPDHPVSSETVQVGSHVLVTDEKGAKVEYALVGSMEADPVHGRISNESPVGKSLLGRRVGEKAEAHTPAGIVTLTIVKIQ